MGNPCLGPGRRVAVAADRGLEQRQPALLQRRFGSWFGRPRGWWELEGVPDLGVDIPTAGGRGSWFGGASQGVMGSGPLVFSTEKVWLI